jgi:chemotaxis protein histidine kinase CheA
MAIYRKGEASLAADGTVTGYGTNWKDQLALVRIGATAVFLNGNAIGAIGTVSAIVSETQLQTIQTDGAVVARGKYFILLHDSLTVDGLAQNVAETLRYYQSSETEIADALDYFRTFDWEKFEKIAKDVKTNAAAAKVSETNAKTSETNAKGSENAAEASKTAAAASQTAAKTSETNAKTSETNAKASENAAAGSKTAAAGSATDAAASKTAAAASQSAAKTSETNAKTSETNAKSSENSALQSKNAAAGSATAAKTSETNSKTSETRAKTSETNSASSAAKATTEADRAKTEADRAAASNPANSLLKAQNLADVPDKTKARENLNLGVNNTVTFSQARLPNGLIITTPSNGAGDNPAAPIVSQILNPAGQVVGQAEFRADRNGNLSIINRTDSSRPQFAVFTVSGDFSAPNFVSTKGFEGGYCELGSRQANQTSYVDFHYGAKYDYDARIYCDGMNSDKNGGGNLKFNAGYMVFSADGGYSITGGRINIETMDINIHSATWFKRDGDAIVLQSKKKSGAVYALGRDSDGSTSWRVGRGGDTDDSVSLYNLKTGVELKLRGGDVYSNKEITSAGNVICNGSGIYVRGGSGANNTHLWLQNSAGRNRAVIYSNDSQVLNLRSDNANTGAGGQALTFNGATGEARATTFTNTSDERAKFWRKKVTGALDKICSLSGETFSMHTTIQDTVRKSGLIAQDVQKVLPEAVSVGVGVTGIIDKECREIENPLALDYNAMSALYVEAIKELKGQIDELRKEIDDLKSK